MYKKIQKMYKKLQKMFLQWTDMRFDQLKKVGIGHTDVCTVQLLTRDVRFPPF